MARKYTKLKIVEKEIMELRKEGKTRREIVERYGIEKWQIKDIITRYNRKQRKLEQREVTNPKGRPRTRPLTINEEKDREIARLRMENELLRIFFISLEGSEGKRKIFNNI